MRQFSRWMPPAPPQAPSLAAWAPVLGYAAVIALMAIPFPSLWLVLGGWAALNVHLRRADAQRWRARAAERQGEDIGRFARAFLRNSAAPFDAWVIRATWDALAVELAAGGPRVPVRPEDDLEDDFDIEDPESLATSIAWRAGRSARAWQVEPALLADLRTVRDLVNLVARQPSLAAAA